MNTELTNHGIGYATLQETRLAGKILQKKHWHQLDFVILKQKHRSGILNTRMYHCADCDTDFSLVVSSLRLQLETNLHQLWKLMNIEVGKI